MGLLNDPAKCCTAGRKTPVGTCHLSLEDGQVSAGLVWPVWGREGVHIKLTSGMYWQWEGIPRQRYLSRLYLGWIGMGKRRRQSQRPESQCDQSGDKP